MSNFHGDWSEGGFQEMVKKFNYGADQLTCPDGSDLTADDVLFAAYMLESYEGAAQVIFRRGETLFELTCSHCSCNGLSWSPTDCVVVTPAALAMRDGPHWSLGDAASAWHAMVAALNVPQKS